MAYSRRIAKFRYLARVDLRLEFREKLLIASKEGKNEQYAKKILNHEFFFFFFLSSIFFLKNKNELHPSCLNCFRAL